MKPSGRSQSRSVLDDEAPVVVDPKSVQTLVEEVRTLLGSDTSTLLLLDRTGRVLEPAASAGLGRRWRGATHVPVGSGFAGRVAATGEPLLLTEINEHTVLNPILRDFGLRQLFGVPVVGTDGILGVLQTLNGPRPTSVGVCRHGPRTTRTWQRSRCSEAFFRGHLR
jgi:signal transduction protein with GAF and PtsI domain